MAAPTQAEVPQLHAASQSIQRSIPDIGVPIKLEALQIVLLRSDLADGSMRHPA